MKNKIRIIGGTWRSRVLPLADRAELRPTPARVRETLFNWLQYDISGAHCLDLFAGSGALGVEAASRGAGRVVQVEKDAAACRVLKQNVGLLQTEQIWVVNRDVERFLLGGAEPFDLVFLDPPFGRNLAGRCCHMLEAGGWLAEQAKIYVEVESRLALDDFPANWQSLRSKTAGEVGYHLYARSGLDESG